MSTHLAWLRSFGAGRLGAPLGFFAATWVLVSLVRVHATAHLDTARDLLIARDCVAGVCTGAGPRSSFGWTHGGLWSRVLEARERLGVSLGGLEELSHFGLAAAAALVAVAVRSLGRAPNPVTWALWFAATLITIGYPNLWNPTLLPLALGGFYAAMLHTARTRSPVMVIVAAAALAVSIDFHIVSVVLVPPMVAAAVACATWPLVTVSTATATMVGVLACSSPGMVAANWPVVAQWMPFVVAALVVAGLAGVMGRRALAMRDGSRADIVARGFCLYIAGLLPLLAIAVDHPLQARYLAPLVPPAAIYISTRRGAARRWVRATTVGVVLAGFIAFAIDERVLNPRFRVSDVDRVAEMLYGRGASYGDLFRHLRGPDAVDLLAMLAVLEPPGPRELVHDERDLLVVRIARGDLPREVPAQWIVVELDASHVAVIVPYVPWVQLEPLEICRGGGQSSCEAVVVDERAAWQHAELRWADRAYPSLLRGRHPDPGQAVSYHLRLRPVPGGLARRIYLLRDPCEGWRVAAGGDGDGRSVQVEADGGARDLVFTVVSGPRCRWWLPPFVEVPDSDTALKALVEALK